MSLDDLIQNTSFTPAIRLPLISHHPALPRADRRALETFYKRLAVYHPDLLLKHPPEEYPPPASLRETRRVLREANRLLREEQYAPPSEGFIRHYYIPLTALLTGGMVGLALSQEHYAAATIIGSFMSLMTLGEIGRLKREVRERNTRIQQSLAQILTGYASYLSHASPPTGKA